MLKYSLLILIYIIVVVTVFALYCAQYVLYSQNYWSFGLFPIVWYSREHDVSETGSVSILI
jgi:hypothetical protein